MTIYHQHHIIPKHMGGSDDPSNLKLVTVEEHAEEHRLLYEEHGHWQDYVAWKGLSGHVGKEEIIYMINARKRSDETKEKMRISHLGKSLSEQHKNNMRGPRGPHKNKRLPISEETRNRMRGPRGPRGPISEEHRAKLCQPRGPYSEERKMKLRGPRKPLTESHKLKIKESLRNRKLS